MTFHGIAPVNVGMTPPEAEAAIRDTLVRYERTPATESCYLVHPESTPTLLFMIEDGRVVRVETESSDFSTLSGVRVGDTEEQARNVYRNRVKAEVHPYDPEGHYLVIDSPDQRFAMILETDGKIVTQIRAGLLPAVRYIEHCL